MEQIGKLCLESYYVDDFVDTLLKNGYTVELTLLEKTSASDKNKILIIIKE